MWKIGQWYRYGNSSLTTRYCCEYITSTGVALLRCEKNASAIPTYQAVKWGQAYIECEPPPWAELQYDPTQQEDNENDI